MRASSTGSPFSVAGALRRVEPDGADLDRRVAGAGRRARAPQHRPDPRDHLAGAERLDDVVVGAELEPDDPVGLLAARREDDDRDARRRAQLAADVEPGAVREPDVEQDEVGAGRPSLARAPSATVCAISVWKPSRSSASASGVVIDSSSSTSRIVRFACAMARSVPARAAPGSAERAEQLSGRRSCRSCPSTGASPTPHQNEYLTPFFSVAVSDAARRFAEDARPPRLAAALDPEVVAVVAGVPDDELDGARPSAWPESRIE